MALLATSAVLQLSCPQFPTGVKHKKHLRVPSSSTEQVRRESGEQQLQEELKQLVNNCLCYRSQYWVYHLHPYAKLHKAFKHPNKSVISFYTLSALTVTLLTMNPLIPSRLPGLLEVSLEKLLGAILPHKIPVRSHGEDRDHFPL